MGGKIILTTAVSGLSSVKEGGADYNVIAVVLCIRGLIYAPFRHLLLATALGENYKPTCDYIIKIHSQKSEFQS